MARDLIQKGPKDWYDRNPAPGKLNPSVKSTRDMEPGDLWEDREGRKGRVKEKRVTEDGYVIVVSEGVE